jgi:uncharacterized protein YcbK (DUF882 family)
MGILLPIGYTGKVKKARHLSFEERVFFPGPACGRQGACPLRSAFVAFAAVVLAALELTVSSPSPAAEAGCALSFYNTHTREHLTVVYRLADAYLPTALAQIDHILRDHASGEEHAIDPHLLDFLYDLLQKVGYRGEVHIISGYRSSETNTAMHERDAGVALGSLHTKGQALDIRLPGIDTLRLYEIARAMRRGGTGCYRRSDFIHIDTGPVRSW